MSGFDCVKLNIKFGGDVSFKDESFAYNGGYEMRDMLMDPDLMTWSIFEDFPKENGVSAPVEKVWYKLAHEDLESVRAIPEDRDSGIRQLCSEALIGGEVDVYIDQGVSEPTPFDLSQPADPVGVEDNEESDVEVEEDRTAEEARVQDDGVDPVEESRDGAVDPRFSAFYEEINAEVGQETHQDPNAEVGEGTHQDTEAEAGHDTHQAGDQTEGEAAGQTEEDEEEFERECMDVERPDPAMDTDEEWDAFDREEREISRAKYSKDRPPYLWMKQQFNSGEEFKDQLLRYVLKANYDVKLCKWGQTQLMAICSSDPRKRGRPRKSQEDDDPWSINNAPKRWKNAQSQSTPPVAQSQPTPNPQHSSAPAANPSGRGRARGRPPGVKNGQGKSKGKGRGKGSDEAPRPPVFFISPWTDKVFDVWRPEKK